MTREEEIREASEEYSAYIDSTDEERYNQTEFEAFKDGALWADKHPAKKQTVTIDAWVARDKCGDLSIWNKQPYRNLIDTCNYWERVDGDSITLPNNTFQTITWENSPKKVKVIIEMEDEQ